MNLMMFVADCLLIFPFYFSFFFLFFVFFFFLILQLLWNFGHGESEWCYLSDYGAIFYFYCYHNLTHFTYSVKMLA